MFLKRSSFWVSYLDYVKVFTRHGFVNHLFKINDVNFIVFVHYLERVRHWIVVVDNSVVFTSPVYVVYTSTVEPVSFSTFYSRYVKSDHLDTLTF